MARNSFHTHLDISRDFYLTQHPQYATVHTASFVSNVVSPIQQNEGAPYTVMQKPTGAFPLQQILNSITTGRKVWPDIKLDNIGERDVAVADCTDEHNIVCAHAHLRLIQSETKRLSALQVTPETAVAIRNQLNWLDHYFPILHLIFHTLIHEHYPQVPYGRGDLRVKEKGRVALVIIPQGDEKQTELPVA